MAFLRVFFFFWLFQQGLCSLVAPEIQPIQIPKKIKSGSTIRIVCSTENGSPPIEFQWYFNGILIQNGKDIRIENSNFQEPYSNLILKPASIGHTGNFTCLASNKAGTDSSHFQIVVHGKFFLNRKNLINYKLLNNYGSSPANVGNRANRH